MKKSAVVKFVGDQEYYRLGCKKTCYAYCRDCKQCNGTKKYRFIYGHLYNAYFLEFWQGERTSLHIKGEDGEIVDFIPFDDFEVVTDEDNVLNEYVAIVRCNTHDFEDEPLEDLTFGKEYKAIGFDTNNQLLVMDNTWDCYFYSRKYFKIIEDPNLILSIEQNEPIYDWQNTHNDTI